MKCKHSKKSGKYLKATKHQFALIVELEQQQHHNTGVAPLGPLGVFLPVTCTFNSQLVVIMVFDTVLYSLPVSLQVNLALGSHILFVPSQSFSSLPSSQSLSPSQLQRSGMQVPSVTQWNSSALHSITGGNTKAKLIWQWMPLRYTAKCHEQKRRS